MRRFDKVLACLSLAVLPSMSADIGSAKGGVSIPQDPLITYLETIVTPVIKGQPLNDDTLKPIVVKEDRHALDWTVRITYTDFPRCLPVGYPLALLLRNPGWALDRCWRCAGPYYRGKALNS